MTAAPTLHAYCIAMLFGEHPNSTLGVCFSVGPSIEIATAHAVGGYIQEQHARGVTLPPLTMIAPMEVEDRMKQLWQTGGQGAVVPFKVVEPTLETPPDFNPNQQGPAPPDGSAA